MLELYTAIDFKQTTAAIGIMMTRDRFAVDHQIYLVSLARPIKSATHASYLATQKAADYRLSLASDEPTHIYAPGPIYRELNRLDSPEYPDLWRRVFPLLFGLQPPMRIEQMSHNHHQRRISNATEAALRDWRPGGMKPPEIGPEATILDVVAELRRCFGDDELERIAEILITSR